MGSNGEPTAAAPDPDEVHITSRIQMSSSKESNLTFSEPSSNMHAKRNSRTKDTTQAETAKEIDVSEDEKGEKMFNVLDTVKRVKLETLVLDKDSFTRTAANILTLSFLLKDGRAEISKTKEGTYFIIPKAETEPSNEDNTKFIYHFSYKDWQLMREQVQNNQESSTLVPKGIRRKNRKRAVYIPREAEELVEKDGTNDILYVEPDNEKGFFTFSRRNKASEQFHNTLKRYRRHADDTGTAMAFQIENHDEDHAFEMLSAAPKRRRTVREHPACTSLAPPDKGEVIQPKRFKKSGLKPRQVLKARLKAILKHQINSPDLTR